MDILQDMMDIADKYLHLKEDIEASEVSLRAYIPKINYFLILVLFYQLFDFSIALLLLAGTYFYL